MKTTTVRHWGTRCQAFADEQGVVRVYDSIAGSFTVCHHLTPGQERYVRSRTQRTS